MDTRASAYQNHLLNPGRNAPDFGFGDDGSFYKLSQFRDLKKVLLIFCAGDLSGCKDGAREIKGSWRRLRDEDLVVMLISTLPTEELAEFSDKESAPIILISDDKAQTAKRYGIRSGEKPIAYLVGKDCVIETVWTHWPTIHEIIGNSSRWQARRRDAA